MQNQPRVRLCHTDLPDHTETSSRGLQRRGARGTGQEACVCRGRAQGSTRTHADRHTCTHGYAQTRTHRHTDKRAQTDSHEHVNTDQHRCWQQHRPTRMLARTHTCRYRHPSACSETQRRTRKYVNRNVRRHRATHANTDSRTLSQKRVQRHSDGDPDPHPQQRPGPSATPRLSRTSLGPWPGAPAGCEVTRLPNAQGLPASPARGVPGVTEPAP